MTDARTEAARVRSRRRVVSRWQGVLAPWVIVAGIVAVLGLLEGLLR